VSGEPAYQADTSKVPLIQLDLIKSRRMMRVAVIWLLIAKSIEVAATGWVLT